MWPRSDYLVRALPEVSLIEVWESYGGRVVGRDSSEWRKALCPIHQEKTPSASVNEDAGKWNCFVCDEHGDVFDLIARMEHLDFRAAVERARSFGSRERSSRRGSSLLPGRRSGERKGEWTPPWGRI